MRPFLLRYHPDAKTAMPEALLHRLRNGTYQMVMPGALWPLVDGFDFNLMDRQLVGWLAEAAPGELVHRPVEIWRKSTGEVFGNHAEVHIGRELAFADYESVAGSGRKIWLMMGSFVYLSAEVANELRPYLSRFPGLVLEQTRPKRVGRSAWRL